VTSEYVRICPVCEQENPPERARCTCGASLAGVDFSLKRAPPTAAPPAPETAPAPAPAPDVAPEAAPVICPHPDCGQPNPPGSERCVYCNRPLQMEAPAISGARPLPAALRDDYRVVDVFPATGSEADILLVVRVKDGQRCVAKLYRKGIAPDFRLLDILTHAVGETVVRVLASGVSEGTAYELLEYIPGGTLEALMRTGPLPKSDIRRVIEEIAAALNGIHAHRILHRDLKPENVLIRAKTPLTLALTDFGIASIAAGTQHFTSVARTTKYAAPEALTGVLDEKADWWSLGMIVLEAASGRHPFDGLTEQVMNHYLATRPIDVRGVYDDELRLLCRGLLLRDPKRRWGGDEVARWLAGDATLTIPDGAEGVASVVRPYRIGKSEATSGAELGVALARHWNEGCRDLKRGQIARWLENDLHDHNLLRVLRDILDRKGLSDDARLARFLAACAPELPPVWRGQPVTTDAIAAQARAAANDDVDAADWLESLYRDDVLAIYTTAGHAELARIDEAWRIDVQRSQLLWDAAVLAEERRRTEPREHGSGTGHRAPSYDDLAFVATGRFAMPAPGALYGPLLVAQTDQSYLDAVRAEVTAGLAALAGCCPWFEAWWEEASRERAGVVVARLLLPHAQADAVTEKRRAAFSAEARALEFETVREAMRVQVRALLTLVPGGDADLSAETVSGLLDAFNGLQAICQRVLRLTHVDVEYDALRKAAEKLSSLAVSVQRALSEAEEIQGVNAIFLTPGRLAIGVAILGAALLLRVPVAILIVVAALVLFAGYRWYAGFRTTETALERLKLFGLHARTFLRSGGENGEKPEATASEKQIPRAARNDTKQ
jgi:hypothetical protein